MTTANPSSAWFVITVATGREEEARELLGQRAEALGLEISIRPGDKGYLVARLPLDETTRKKLLKVRGVRGLLGGRRPVTVSEEDLAVALASRGKIRKPPVRLSVRFFKR